MKKALRSRPRTHSQVLRIRKKKTRSRYFALGRGRIFMESLELEVEEPVAGLAVRLLDEDLAEVVHVLDHVQHLEV